MDKLKLHSPNLTEANIAKIAELFPSCIVEAKNESGELTQKVDFDQLRQELSDSIVEGAQERYRLDWPGKREALRASNAPIAKTLRPSRAESESFNKTQNLFIEGDNLDALKLLEESYLGAIKLIFIDPPYNTGNDFLYEDDFSENSNEYLIKSNQRSDDGERLVANTEGNGRYHSDWLSFMYSRLRKAYNLLSDDGFIAVTIDDNELPNLRKILDQIFGEMNFVANVAWKHTEQSKNDERYFSRQYNALVIYRKSSSLNGFSFPRTEADNVNYRNPDDDPKGKWRSGDVRSPNLRNTLRYDIRTPSGKRISPPANGWRWSETSLKEKINTGEIIFNSDETGIVRKIYLSNQKGRTPENLWSGELYGTTRQANAEIKALFDDVSVFDTPKPSTLIKRLCNLIFEEKNYTVLDFFAGSGTTAHGVMQLNAEDGGHRKFILVQLPEPCDKKSDAHKAGFNNIVEISKERIRRAGKKIKDENATTAGNLDVGFRVLKIDTSNAKDIYYTPDAISQEELALQVDHIKEDRTAEDLLFQVMLDWGVDLALPISKESIQGKEVYFVDENAIAACFETAINEAFVKELAKREPLRVVFRDTCFESDSAKINVAEIFKLLSPNTDIKTI